MPETRIIKPKQKRSFATRQRVKEATNRMFVEQGYYNVSSNHIAKEAGVPVGSFYNYFGNKKVILLELIADFNTQFHTDTMYDALLENIEFTSKKEVFGFIESLLQRTLLNSNLSNPFYRVMHALQFTEPDVLSISREVRSVEIEFLEKVLSVIDRSFPIENIPILAKLMHSSVENIALYIHHLGSDYKRQELIEESAKMFCGYIFTDR